MKTFRQYLKHITETEHHSSSTEDTSDTDDDIEDMSPEEGEALIRQKFGPKELPQFDRLNKSAEFDFRKGIVEPEPEEWEPDVRIGKPVEPYDREAEFLAAFDQPDNRFTAPAGWRYVEKDEDPARYGNAPAGNELPDLKYDPQSRTLKAVGAPALDLSEPKSRYKFNRFSQQQEPVGSEPDDSKATEVKTSTWRDIYRLNRKTIGSDPRLIKPGQVLKMPNGAPDHTVQKGDTLIRIAAQDSTAAQFKQPDRPVTPTPVQRPAATITPIPGNIQPRVTANTGLNFPPHAGFALDKGEEIVTPNTLKARKQAADFMAAYEKKQQARAELKQAAKRSMKEGSTGFIKHLRDYIVEVETAPGDATSVATGLASAALPKIGEASELDRILAIARHPR
jgi:hypothetical protein